MKKFHFLKNPISVLAIVGILVLSAVPFAFATPAPSSTFTLATTDNDFLWNARTAFYISATPFGIWGATPNGCALSAPGTGICAAALGANGYANLGGSSDYGTFTLSNNHLQTSVWGNVQYRLSDSGVWEMSSTYSFGPSSSGVGKLPLQVSENGWLNFGGDTPSQASFQSGFLEYYIYINAPAPGPKGPDGLGSQVLAAYPEAQYVAHIGWVVSFQIYIQTNYNPPVSTGCFPSNCPIPSPYFGWAGNGQFTSADLSASSLLINVGGTATTSSTVTVGVTTYTVWTTNGFPVLFSTGTSHPSPP